MKLLPALALLTFCQAAHADDNISRAETRLRIDGKPCGSVIDVIPEPGRAWGIVCSNGVRYRMFEDYCPAGKTCRPWRTE